MSAMSRTPKTNHVYCPHCDSNNEPYFSRSLPMGFYCRDCGKDVDEKQSDQTMSDTSRMDSAFNQPTSTTPRRNWQLDQCYREGCKLERELATVTKQRDRLAEALRGIKNELGVPQPEYPAPVANAVRIASQALAAVKGGPQRNHKI
jgi:hypothetical protein